MIAVGTETVLRLRLDRDAGRIVIDESWRPRYGPGPEQSYGWDPVITDHHVFWMDNGRNQTDRTMRGSGEAAGPVRLWWARRDDSAIRSVEISGLPFGTESNPPGWDPVGKIVVAYDAGNAVLRAWRLAGDELEPLWRRDCFAHAGHLIIYPDTRELVAQDWRDRRCSAVRDCAGRCGPPSSFSHTRRRYGAPRCRSAAISSSSSTSTAARRRPGRTSARRARRSSSRPPASAATSTTSR